MRPAPASEDALPPPVSPFSLADDGVRVRLRVHPGAGRSAVAGIVREADGSAAIKVLVTAPPHDGKANQAVIALLAKEWRVARSALAIAGGGASRRKFLTVVGEANQLTARLSDWTRALAVRSRR
jgi:hypothetical protein